METFSTVQKSVHEQVTDLLKVCLRLLHTFSYRIEFRTLSMMYKNARNQFCTKASLRTVFRILGSLTVKAHRGSSPTEAQSKNEQHEIL